MRKFSPNSVELFLCEGHGGGVESRSVLIQPSQPVMIVRDPSEHPWAYLTGYDFDEDYDGWLPGGA